MFATRRIVSVLLFCLIFGDAIEESGQLLTQEAECLRLCRLAREEGSKMELQVSSRIPSCHECLHRSREHQALNQRAIKQRKRKSLSPQSGCPGSSPAPFGDWTPSEVKVTFGQYENSNHWYVNCTWTPMNDSDGKWNGILVRLVVDNPDNFVDEVNCYVLPKNQTFFSANISSYDYHYPNVIHLKVIGLPFSKDVSDIQTYFPLTTVTTSSTRDYSTGTAAHLTTAVPRTTLPSSTAHLTSDSNNTVAYAVSISSGILVGLALVGGLLAYFLRRKKYSIPLPSDFKYHAFIIYNNEDRLWMKNKLLPLLEDKHHLKCCVHYRDFVLGRPFRDNMADSVYESNKVIALFSSNSVNSYHWKYELDLAIGRQLAKRDSSLAVIRIDGVDCEQLPSELKSKSLIDYNDLLERPFWRRKLLRFLGLPESTETHTAIGEQNGDNNNNNGNHVIADGNRRRTGFARLDSTTSNASDISYVSA